MTWFTDRHLFLLAVILYGVSTIYSLFLWRRGFREDNRVNYVLLLGAFALHTSAMIQRGFSLQHCPVNNLFEATMFVGWAIVTTYLVVGLWWRLRFLGAFASPVLLAIGLFALNPQLDPPHGPKPEFTGAGTSLHASLILLAYGAFGLASVAALMYLTQEHDLKFHKLRAIFSLFPPIQRLESITGRFLLAGLILLTAGLAIGAHWLKLPPGTTYFGDTKVIWSLFVWLLYLGLLVLRWRFAQGGRRFAWGAIGCFVFVLLTFLGQQFVVAHSPSMKPVR